MKYDFRSGAQQALQRARAELEAGADERLRYVALELRMCIEAITYDRAQTYIDELPPEEYKTWKPQHLLATLVEIEPLAASGGRWSLDQESAPEESKHSWVDLGEDRVFGIRDIQRNYHKLSNFLHFPTLGQVQAGGVNVKTIRDHCQRVVAALEHVLASPLHSANFKDLITFDCAQCQSKVRKRTQPNEERLEASCFSCKAEYVLSRTEECKYMFERKTLTVHCPSKECTHKFEVPVEQIKQGAGWTCLSCNKGYGFFLGVFPARIESR